jgi:lactoylglutathione lyase
MDSATNLKQAVPFFMVTNMERSLAFYVKGLGFEVKIDWKPGGTIEWCWLERDGVALMLQEYREGRRPAEKSGTGFSVCFMCRDALKLYDEFLQKGLSLPEPFVGNNLWVVELNDPDNYKIMFESPTEVPEETTYSSWIEANRPL